MVGTHLQIGQVWEERVSPVLQRPLHRAQHAGQVGTEGPEQDGEVPPLLHQVPEELEEGGQDPVVQPPVFSFGH